MAAKHIAIVTFSQSGRKISSATFAVDNTDLGAFYDALAGAWYGQTGTVHAVVLFEGQVLLSQEVKDGDDEDIDSFVDNLTEKLQQI